MGGGGGLSEIPYILSGTEKRGGETKILKRGGGWGGKLVQGVGALKRGAGTPL